MSDMSVLYTYFGGICTHMCDMGDMSVLNLLYDGLKNSPEVLVKFTIFYVAAICAIFSLFLDLCVIYTTRGRVYTRVALSLPPAAAGRPDITMGPKIRRNFRRDTVKYTPSR